MNKEEECEIVQDLFLNYIDDTLHNHTKQFVEGHIKMCNDCKEKLTNIQKEIEEQEGIKSQEKEVNYLKKINKKNKRKKELLMIVSFILAILIIFNVAVFINYNNIKQSLDMKIFLKDDITKEQQDQIEKAIKEQDHTAQIVYVSKEEGLEKAKEQFSDKKNLLETYSESNPFKAYYSVKTEKVEEVENIVETKEGISSITAYHFNPYELFIGVILQKINTK